MKNIKERHVPEFDGEDYKEIVDGVYLNQKKKNYCFAYECILEEKEGQYPLEDLLDNYLVSCSDYYGDEIEEDGVKKSIVKIETLNTKKKSLIDILNYSTIVGKTINNVELNGHVYVGRRVVDGKITIYDEQKTLPMFCARNGEENFEFKNWEARFIRNFDSGVNLDKLCEDTEKYKKYQPKAIVLKDRRAYISFVDLFFTLYTLP